MTHSNSTNFLRSALNLCVIAACLSLAACGDDKTTGESQNQTPTELEVGGIWSDNYGGWTVVQSSSWGNQVIHQYDNDGNWAVTQNAADAEYSPSKFNYVVWTDAAADGHWWTCTVAFDIDTLEAALETENTSDSTDPSMGGCGDFAWTQMTPRDAIEVAGQWVDNFGGESEVSAMQWGSSRIHDYDNTANWAITQSPADDEYTPSQFSYIVWTDAAEDGSWWTCTVAFGLETAEAAMATENTSDASDPENGGCGDFSWTKMTSRP